MRNKKMAKETIKKLAKLGKMLKSDVIGRETEIDFLLACVASEVPVLLLGDPGTGKSYLVKKFSEYIGAEGSDYFHYLLTQFTEPTELFGPLDMNKLMGDRNGVPVYTRVIDGKLPEATIVFLDEVFKANSAILNTLLTLVNEKKFYNNGKWEDVPLKVLVTASNEMPESEELKAFVDRIPIKIHSKYLDLKENQNTTLRGLIQIQLKGEKNRKEQKKKEEKEVLFTLDDIRKGIDSLIYEYENVLETVFGDWDLVENITEKIEKIRNKHNYGILNCNISDRKVISILKVAIAKKMIENEDTEISLTFEDIQEVLCTTWDDLSSANELKNVVYDEY